MEQESRSKFNKIIQRIDDNIIICSRVDTFQFPDGTDGTLFLERTNIEEADLALRIVGRREMSGGIETHIDNGVINVQYYIKCIEKELNSDVYFERPDCYMSDHRIIYLLTIDRGNTQ